MHITVFTPTYNRDKYITNLFDSLCKQTILPCEWIIVDQGNDRTGELAKVFIAKASFPVIYNKLYGERGISRATPQYYKNNKKKVTPELPAALSVVFTVY